MDRNEAYHLLSDLIYKGFLTLRMKIADKDFVFKTVNEKEHNLIKLYSGFSDKGYAVRFNLNYMAFSLLMVEGKNFLINRNNKIKECYNFFGQFPYQLHNRIMKELIDLRDVAFGCIDYVEGFSYTDQSRRKWNISYKLNSFSDFPGSKNLGMNAYQESWILINKMLDDEEIYNKDFSLALLVASASNPKGTRSIRGRHDAAVQRAEERRKKLSKKGSHQKQAWKPDGWAAPVDTAEELVAELMRQMEGKKDKHDLFIDDYMKKLRERADEQTRQAEKRLQKLRERRKKEGDIPDIISTQRILTAEESEKLNKKSNNLMIVKSEEVADKNEEERFYKKIGSRVLTGK